MHLTAHDSLLDLFTITVYNVIWVSVPEMRKFFEHCKDHDTEGLHRIYS